MSCWRAGGGSDAGEEEAGASGVAEVAGGAGGAGAGASGLQE